MKLKLIIAFLFLYTLSLHSQTVVTTTKPWDYLSGGVVAAKDSVWDEPSYFPVKEQLIKLGFTFKAFGKSMDSMWLDQGGVLSLDQEFWVGLWEDLCDKGFGGTKPLSPIRIVNSGMAGDKKVEIEWRNFGFFGDFEKNGFCSDSGNIRLTIYEKSQSIDLWFGPSSITQPSVNFPKGIVIFTDRLDSTGNATGIDLKGDPSNPEVVPVNEVNHSTLNSWPANGTVYTFSYTPGMVEKTDVQKAGYYSEGFLYFPVENNTVFINDFQGKKLIEFQCDKESKIPSLPTGNYIVTVKNNLGINSFKIQIQSI